MPPFGPWPGETGGTKTLASVYANGTIDPVHDNLFGMLHGNMRFESATNTSPLPVLGYWEDQTGTALSFTGVPAALWSLACTLGTDNGRVFNVNQMLNTTWNGTFLAINGMSWQIERESFTGDPTQFYNVNVPTYGTRSLKVLNAWPPFGYPQGVTSDGTVRMESQLWNTKSDALVDIEYQYGWGQYDYGLMPQTNGITWQWATHWDNAAIAVPAADDGVGWGIYKGDIKHDNKLQAAFTARQVTADPLGDWYWSMFVPDGSGGLTDVADFAKSGITFYAPVKTNTVGLALAAYRTAVVDLTTPATSNISMPTIAGYRFFMTGTARIEMHTRDATLTTGLTFDVTQNGVAVPGATGQTISITLFNGFGPPAMLNGNPVNLVIPDMSAFPLQFKITTGVAGVGLTSCTGRLVIFGYYAPYP